MKLSIVAAMGQERPTMVKVLPNIVPAGTPNKKRAKTVGTSERTVIVSTRTK